MGVIFQAGYSLPGSDEPLTHARIAHAGNWLANGSAVASDTDAAYFAEGPLNSLTYEKWSPFANALAQPEDFEDAEWVKTRVTVAGALMTEDSSAGTHFVQDSSITFADADYSFSADVKAFSRTEIRLFVFDGTVNHSAYFNISSGTVGTGVGATGAIRDLGGGIYRCTIKFTAAAGSGLVQIRLSSGSETDSYTGDGASGIYIYSAWLSKVAATWEYAHTKSSSCDYICIGAHTLGSDGATFKVQYHNGSIWVDLCAAQSPTDDSPIYAIFAPVTASRYRLNISSFARSPKVGIFKAGLSLQMERPLYGQYNPPDYARRTELRSNYSESGEFMGRTKVRTYLEFNFSWRLLSRSWCDSNWLPFLKQTETEPMFIAPIPGTRTETTLCQTSSQPSAPTEAADGFLSVSLDLRGYGHD